MIEFLDGFDHYSDNTNLTRKWDVTAVAANYVTGRFGGNAVQPDASGMRKLLSGSFGTLVVGFAFQRSSFGNFGLVCFHDGGTLSALGTNQVDLRVTSTGALQVTRNGTVLGTSSGTLAASTWYYIEFKAAIGSSGSYQVQVAGATFLSGTGNTQNSANPLANQVSFNIVAGDNGRGTTFDDVYVLNPSGTVNNDFLGECRILTSLPTGDDAAFKQWTPSTGTNHYANVDDSSPNDDTDCNSDATAGHIDLFTFPAIAPTGAVAAVQTVLTARKDDIGSRQICEECRYSSVNYNGANAFTLNSTYGMFREIREKNPTGIAWTGTSVNAAEFGVKLVL